MLQAAVAAEHDRAPAAAHTGWARIAVLYAALEARTGSPVVRLNRAVAVAEGDGPAAGLALLADLDERLGSYHLLPATRADLLRRLGDGAGARAHYARAPELAGNDADRAFLAGRLAGAGDRPCPTDTAAGRTGSGAVGRDGVGPPHGHCDDEPGDR